MTATVIIGGGSGMGLALAHALVGEGEDVILVGRSADRLAAARAVLEHAGHGQVHTRRADISRADDVAGLFSGDRPVDHVVVTAADATGVYGPTARLATDTARSVLNTKLLGAWLVGKYAVGTVTESLTFTSGINAYRPNGSNTIMAAANGALASLAAGLAIEIAPIRVNVVSPGWVDTPIWNQLGVDTQEAFTDMAQRLPARRIGVADDIVKAFLAVMRNRFITATVLHVDGGHRFV
ncbi:SDR family oxidoreductase [Nocardia cyriacigeorgica]|uniref:SDR family oxidoreductase n=1 Tax=Nocardia cyriacigeorgica TaxID=135487 RepID=UPI000CEB79B7|nr:SDR family oxidoreductase [Nocardia cyriacigeorgica]AVH23744.1 short chain dehydrogenase [Nocardia cyriacigeorgica]MBF6090259.1 SDR family oxidoreductase [Nocardia cyriacigeorgica]MBF6094781.1 SDR family oxidoreductase [Nocardia cyriacigeorgica]MBF6324028.1 SDR family oxidoreductase [Nocardia cyriacigeorgica]MBF6399203.1 SDR family oxidoreductase [Nocardia cyriacigeorgica]